MTTQNEMHFTRRIGSSIYHVKVVVPNAGHDTIEDIILRIIKNETGLLRDECDTIGTLQMSRPA